MPTFLSIVFFGSLVGGLGALAAAIVFPERRVSALYVSTALLVVVGWLSILSIGIFILIVPFCTGLAAASLSRRRRRHTESPQ
ncbi:hypothetical protein [Candidatus Poriferisodalis sp.]|uniref:hypothetical protein n=1 Tax=Candidatus Poriferisodalis sp. TaxID=3101277 RepID=UPI003D14A9E2